MFYKYPRTFHLPWSLGKTSDDKMLTSVNHFIGKRVIVTEKMDGENTSMYTDHYHARSIDSKNHPSRNIVKRIWGEIKHEIPVGWRIVGENVYAKHSIHYENLSSYFYIIAVFNDRNMCLSWDETKEWASLLNLPVVPELYDNLWDESSIKALWPRKSKCGMDCEGYVVRIADSFDFNLFENHIAKFVRANHVITSKHWLQEEIIPNIVSLQVENSEL